MSTLRSFYSRVRQQLWPDDSPAPAASPEATQPESEPMAGPEPPRSAAEHAYQELYAPRHAAEEQLAYRPVNGEGVVLQEKEAWFREGGTLRSTRERTLVVTCSGQVVSPDAIKVRCLDCGGFDAVMSACAQCGGALCRRHAQVFPPSGRVLCHHCRLLAWEQFDTWSAADQA